MKNLADPTDIFAAYAGLGSKLRLRADFASGYGCPEWLNPVMSPVWLRDPKPSADDLSAYARSHSRRVGTSKYDSPIPYLRLLKHPSLPFAQQVSTLRESGWTLSPRSENLLYWSAPWDFDFSTGLVIRAGNVRDAKLRKSFQEQNSISFGTSPAFSRALEKMYLDRSEGHLIVLLETKQGTVAASGLVCSAKQHAYLYCGSVNPRYRGRGLWRQLIAARQAVSRAQGAEHWVTTSSNPLIRNSGMQNFATQVFLAPER